jgi:transposase-like protein
MTNTCPQCQSRAAVLLAQVSRMSPLNHYTCSNCGHTWTTPKEAEGRRDEDDVPPENDG